jgi:tRNA nucleotidyltransferase (CCA-adding enzyme)
MMASMFTDRAEPLLAAFRSLPAAAPLLPWLEHAENVHLVGGAVRDLMLGHAPGELDFVVEGELDAVIADLAAPVRSHGRFGTCTVELEGFRYDFARARRERYRAPGALPEVSPADLAADLRRRDFTVNAFALSLTGHARGTLVAVDDAPGDLRGRRLRVLHDASFRDDPTRLLRLARYLARLTFGVEPHTLDLAEAAIAGGALRTITGARAGAELRLLAAEPEPVAAFTRLHELGVDEALAPRFGLVDPRLAHRALSLLADDGDRGTLVLAAAGLRMDPVRLAELLRELAFTAGEREAILAAAGGAQALAQALGDAARPSEIVAAIGERAHPELVALAGALGPAQAAREWRQSLRDVRLEIDGNDLLAAGVPAGPRIGMGLRAALAAKLDGRVPDRAAELAVALGAASGGRPLGASPGTG